MSAIAAAVRDWRPGASADIALLLEGDVLRGETAVSPITPPVNAKLSDATTDEANAVDTAAEPHRTRWRITAPFRGITGAVWRRRPAH
jgi:hypothetical protein